MANITNDNIFKEFFDSLINGERTKCSILAIKFLEKNSLQELYENILKKALYDIGELWEYNKISVATEHLASAIVESILNECYYKTSFKEKNKKVLLACIESEYHQIGIKMVSDIFELNGWKSHFLGANTPLHALISYARAIKPDLIALSISIYFHFPELEKMIQIIREHFPDLPILIGGQAFRHGGINILTKYENVIYKEDLKSIELFIQQ